MTELVAATFGFAGSGVICMNLGMMKSSGETLLEALIPLHPAPKINRVSPPTIRIVFHCNVTGV